MTSLAGVFSIGAQVIPTLLIAQVIETRQVMVALREARHAFTSLTHRSVLDELNRRDLSILDTLANQTVVQYVDTLDCRERAVMRRSLVQARHYRFWLRRADANLKGALYASFPLALLGEACALLGVLLEFASSLGLTVALLVIFAALVQTVAILVYAVYGARLLESELRGLVTQVPRIVEAAEAWEAEQASRPN